MQNETQAGDIVTYTGSAVVLDPIERVLTELESRHTGVVYDLSRPADDKAARQARLELVRTRTSADKAYKEWNSPLLAEQRKARERVAEINRRVLALEEPIDKLIKADEERKAEARREAEREEAERQAKITQRIAVITGLPLAVINHSADDIEVVIDEIGVLRDDQEALAARFDERAPDAVIACDTALIQLRQIHGVVLAREQQAHAIREAQLQIEREREELARQADDLARQRADQEERIKIEETLRLDRERAIADKAARDAEDARRSAAGQSDAFTEEKREAAVIISAERAAAKVEEADAGMAQRDQLESITHTAPLIAPPRDPATAQAATDVTQADGPSAGRVVELVAIEFDMTVDEALQFLRGIDFNQVEI